MNDWVALSTICSALGSVERLALRERPDRHGQRLKKWLYQRGVPFRQRVLVLPVFTTSSTPAIVTTWKMIVTHAEAFFSSDNTVVTNAAAHWCLYQHHDAIFHFGHHGPHRAKMNRRPVQR